MINWLIARIGTEGLILLGLVGFAFSVGLAVWASVLPEGEDSDWD